MQILIFFDIYLRRYELASPYIGLSASPMKLRLVKRPSGCACRMFIC